MSGTRWHGSSRRSWRKNSRSGSGRSRPTTTENYTALRGLEYPPAGNEMPQYFGHLTNDIVYARLAPGVKQELKRVTPRDEKGRHRHKLFQRLTDDLGHPRLREHLASVVALMKVSGDYGEFESYLNKVHRRWDDHPDLFDGIES